MNAKELQRLTKVETRLDAVCKKLDDVKRGVEKITDNELPHIQADIANLNTEVKVNSVKVAAVVGVLSVIGSAVINWVTK